MSLMHWTTRSKLGVAAFLCKINEWGVCGSPASSLWCGFRYLKCFFSIVLGCPGLCLNMLLICMTVLRPLASQGVLQCEKWCLCASFSVYGGKWMIETLWTGRGRWGKLYLCFSEHCIYARGCMCLLCWFVIVTSLFILLFLVRWIFVYTSYPMYLGAHLTLSIRLIYYL